METPVPQERRCRSKYLHVLRAPKIHPGCQGGRYRYITLAIGPLARAWCDNYDHGFNAAVPRLLVRESAAWRSAGPGAKRHEKSGSGNRQKLCQGEEFMDLSCAPELPP